jgi:sn-glycerol 3-phosphate transport system ATP-binding protein
MRSGRIEQSGSPAELYARPATIFSARFIGTPPMNVVAARSVVAANGKFPLEAPNGANPDQLAVGVRPEDVRVDAEGVAARVVAVEFLGADTLVETRIADEPFMLRVAGRSTAAPGDVLGVAWAGGAAHWFDLSSGSRMT